MGSVWTMGEILVEIMRKHPGAALSAQGIFAGPFPSGAPAIFADTAARLGHESGIIGAVGDDAFGTCVLERLQNDGVDTSFVATVPGQYTGCAFVSYSQSGSRDFIFHLSHSAAATAACPPDPAFADGGAIVRDAGSGRYFHLMGCSLTVSESLTAQILDAADHFVAAGAKLSFDPNLRPELMRGDELERIIRPLARRASILLPGEEELRALAGATDIEQAVEAMFSNPTLETIALKRGERGCTVFSRAGSFSVQPFRIEMVDPTGAGDCFDAAFVCGVLDGLPLEKCASRASAAGALNAMVLGPMEGAISAESIDNLISTHGRSGR